MAKQWYVIHTQTGWEDKVKSSLEKRVKQDSKEAMISQILVPTEKVAEIREGKKKISQRKFFPGYILLEMDLNDDTWYLVKNTPGVSGFIGPRARPVPLQEEEIKAILKHTEEAQEKPMPKTIFEKGEGVRVVDGPFVNFNGSVDEINPIKGKLKVIISIFGRATPVELEYWQVEKV
ncbi:MAG: transcription termination/antitermination protein NusG [Candidatus Omnitrophota bacterium]